MEKNKSDNAGGYLNSGDSLARDKSRMAFKLKGWILIPKSREQITKEKLATAKITEEILMAVNLEDVTFMIEEGLPPRIWLKGELVDPPDFALTGMELTQYGFSLIEQLEMLGTICINTAAVNKLTRDKLAAGQFLAKHGIPVPKTIPLNKNVTAEMIDRELGFPVIVKPNSEYGGKGVELIRTPDEYTSYMSEYSKNITGGELLAQEFIAVSKGKDLRVVMVGEKPLYAIVRKASDPGEFRSNLSVGGHAVPYEITDEIRALSVKVVRALNTRLAGIDYLFTENGVVVGEVNSVPGIVVTDVVGLPSPQIVIKHLTAYIASEMMSRPAPKWKVDACIEQALNKPLAEALLKLPDEEFPGIQRGILGNCEKVQESVLLEILNRCKDTAFGKLHNFADIHSIEEYRAKMPLTEWADYEEYAKRLEAGESDLLFPGRAQVFYHTSGTTGNSKHIPESTYGQTARKLILRSRMAVLFSLAKNNLEGGKVLSMSNASVSSVTSGGIPCGSASGQTVESLPPEMSAFMAYPPSITTVFSGDDLNYMTLRCALTEDNIIGVIGNNAARLTALSEYALENAQRLIEDIRAGECALSIPEKIKADIAPFLTPKPNRAQFLSDLLDNDKFIPKYYWPRIILADFWLGGSVGVYVKEAARILPDNVTFMDVGYGASELKINIPLTPNTPAGALAPYCGFFEFIPLEGNETVPLMAHQLEDGRQYELVVTTYAGLYRYRMRDIIQVDGFIGNTPNIFFVTKLGDIGSIEQEKLPGSVFAQCMHTALERLGLNAIAVQGYTDMENKRYNACIELLDSDGVDLNTLAEALEKELLETAQSYKRARERVLKPLTVNLMKPGWKDHLYEKHGKSAMSITQVKLPVIISKLPESEWILY